MTSPLTDPNLDEPEPKGFLPRITRILTNFVVVNKMLQFYGTQIFKIDADKNLKNVMVSKMLQSKKPQNHCHEACFPLEIVPSLPYRGLGQLHDVADHYIKT